MGLDLLRIWVWVCLKILIFHLVFDCELEMNSMIVLRTTQRFKDKNGMSKDLFPDERKKKKGSDSRDEEHVFSLDFHFSICSKGVPARSTSIYFDLLRSTSFYFVLIILTFFSQEWIIWKIWNKLHLTPFGKFRF